ncbi:putative short-chain dehydrogenase [Actinoplanes missouriensis 431]|uniref:Putative short-chain dehydrogenase n=1 Tax=Actinoplanes missouriensis (strain ATCC 14538 / DSM 43046 / CBS 188.64 / JCM 3121 / NBRC 102363 / NCIMB 12654 / NRRL B-3342 / UNCC 431) TaxID=512565 RepID=I0H129_ACTM4|nr:SDR family NAD(P)-dependent oxidoreductase [Actinoplanes missouriensis]BAL86716.1 putative short-chain dehydrogenase [Actinoplanes missouriensis 431]
MGRTIVVTGGSSGVGLAAAEQFAALGDDVVLVGRDPQRLAAAVARVREAGGGREPGRFRADFESFAEVRTLADHLLTSLPRIDVLANNAGGMVGEYRRTADGFEATMQGNHLSPFLLTSLLRERLRDARVVNTASRAHVQGKPDPERLAGDPEKYSAWQAYGASKAANILFAAEAARRWPDITSVSFHPGVVRSNFGAGRVVRLFYKYAPGLVTPEKAGELLVWLSTAPKADLVQGGYYVGRDKPAEPAPHARDDALAAKLWERIAEATG